jgi:hypothetical protein
MQPLITVTLYKHIIKGGIGEKPGRHAIFAPLLVIFNTLY